VIAFVRKLASLRITVFGIAVVLVLIVGFRGTPEVIAGWIVMPLALLAINLVAAVATNPVFRLQPALLVFHICLLALVLLLGAGSLARFDGHVELVEGETFTPGTVSIEALGPWHRNRLEQIAFEQGRIQVDYLPGLRRRYTRSSIVSSSPGGSARAMQIGDAASANFAGYRFSTSFNKGYALIVLWSGDDGLVRRGAINFPSFPEYEWRQRNTWQMPGGGTLEFDLSLDRSVPADAAWVLSSDRPAFSVVIRSIEMGRDVLRPGDTLRLAGGSLTIEELRLWMGYRVDAWPFLPWVFASAMLGILALAAYFLARFRLLQRAGSVAGPERGLACE